MLSITAEVSSLSPPYLKFLCCTAFSSRAFIFLSDLITQWINSNQDVNSGGYSRHAVVSPVLFSLSRIPFPDLTSAKNPIHFARLNSNINYSVEKKSWRSHLSEFSSLNASSTWCVHLFSFLTLLISIFISVSPNGRSPWDQRQCYPFLYPWLMVYYLDIKRCSTNIYESWCWMNWSIRLSTHHGAFRLNRGRLETTH